MAVQAQASSGATSSLTAFATSSDASHVAAGFRSGVVLLFRGELANPGARVKAPTVINVADAASQDVMGGGGAAARVLPVTSVLFGERPVSGGGGLGGGEKHVRLFVSTDDPAGGGGGVPPPSTAAGLDMGGGGLLVSYDASGPPGSVLQPYQTALLDPDRGCGHHCTAYHPMEQQVMVGRDDGVYFFTAEDRGGAAGFEGAKQALGMVGEYIFVASHHQKSKKTELSIYDLREKVSVHSTKIKQHATAVLTAEGSGTAFVLTSGGASSGDALLRLREKDTSSKLDLLFKMNLFSHAIILAKHAKLSDKEVNDIYRMYGDHKYKKCDWDGAIAQYVGGGKCVCV